MYKKNKTKKVVFVVSFGTYNNNLLVSVGQTYKELQNSAKKLLFKGTILDNEDVNYYITDQCVSGLFHKTNTGDYVIWLKEFSNKWYSYEVLLHELHHVVHNFSYFTAMTREMEAQAYLFEHLFRESRKRLVNYHEKNIQ
jgi:hypothetical protein